MDKKEFSPALWSLEPNVAEDPSEILGILTFEGDKGFELEILAGVLLDWPKIPTEGGFMQTHTAEGLRADQVYGFSQTGDYYLLNNVSSPGPGIACPGMEHQSLHGASLFVSRQPMSANPVVRSITFKIPGLREWVGVVPFNVSTRIEDNRFSGISFDFNLADATAISLYEDKEIKISINLITTRKGGPIPAFSFEFEADCEIEILFKGNDHDFDDAMEKWVYPVISFLAFCMGFKYSISALNIEAIDGIKAAYYAPFVGALGSPSSSQLRSMPFPYTKIGESVGVMIAGWYDFDDYLRNGSTLITSLMNEWNMPLDMLFLASAQAFEAISRSQVDECEISSNELMNRLKVIKESNLGARIKKWACYKLKYAKWKSANHLAKDLIEKLGEFATYIVPDSGRYLAEHRAHRDSYTHRRSLDENEELSNEELYAHMEATQLLAYGAIAYHLGIKPNEILTYFKDSRFRWNSIYRTRKQYAVSE